MNMVINCTTNVYCTCYRVSRPQVYIYICLNCGAPIFLSPLGHDGVLISRVDLCYKAYIANLGHFNLSIIHECSHFRDFD